MKTKRKNTSQNSINPVDAAINHLSRAQLIMLKELKGENPLGMYSEFRSLIKLIKLYKKGSLKVNL